MNLSSDSLTRHMLRNLFLMGTEITCLPKRGLNKKQEYKVVSHNTCITELQQQTYAQRFEVEDAQHGYVESRREQVRLQEELVMKEKALRDAQVCCIHVMGELKRAQELRVGKFSVQKLRESHDTIQKLTSQLQELQERVNCMNDSGEFQDMESNYS